VTRGPYAALIDWFARNSVAANLLMVILLAGGLYNVFSIKKEIQPRIETNFVTVSVPFLGATPSDVEEGVVIKIEEAIQDIEGIKEIYSTASRGSGTVRVEVMPEYEVTDVMDQVKNRVDAIPSFPDNTEKPVISRTQFQQQVIFVTVYGDIDERSL
jgi:multidrug efflux pump subunit AcrB